MSVDVIALRVVADEVRFAAVRRTADPFVAMATLPGVVLLEGERLEHAGRRALQSKAGITAMAVGQIVVFDEPSRDPRGATLSVALWAVADGPGRADWRPLEDPGTLAFDHTHMIGACRPLLARLLWNDATFTRALTGESFAVGDALAITTSLTGTAPDRGNFNKKLASVPGLVRQGHGSGRGRPSLWSWQPDEQHPDGGHQDDAAPDGSPSDRPLQVQSGSAGSARVRGGEPGFSRRG